MPGPIQSAVSEAVSTVSTVASVGKKIHDIEKQASEKASAETKAKEEAEKAIKTEAQESALEADLIRMGADPESASAFMKARKLGLDTKQFPMIRKKGRYFGSFSTVAEKLSKASLTDSLSSKVINQEGFAQRVVALGGTRKERVKALVEASKGGKK